MRDPVVPEIDQVKSIVIFVIVLIGRFFESIDPQL